MTYYNGDIHGDMKINRIDTSNEPKIIESTNQAKKVYGEAYGVSNIIVTREQILELLEGKTMALTIQQEYSVFIKMGNKATLKDN